MLVLGILVILLGIGFVFGGMFLVGAIMITLGIISIAVHGENSKKKKEARQSKKETEKKETWIAKRVTVLMRDEGLLPSDAKVKAESEYILAREEERKELNNPTSAYNAYLSAVSYIKKNNENSDYFNFAPRKEDSTVFEAQDAYRVCVEYKDDKGENHTVLLHAVYKNPYDGWKCSEIK